MSWPFKKWNEQFQNCSPSSENTQSNLSAKDELEDPHDKDPGDSHEEGEDGGEKETPPFSLLQAVLRIELKFDKFVEVWLKFAVILIVVSPLP